MQRLSYHLDWLLPLCERSALRRKCPDDDVTKVPSDDVTNFNLINFFPSLHHLQRKGCTTWKNNKMKIWIGHSSKNKIVTTPWLCTKQNVPGTKWPQKLLNGLYIQQDRFTTCFKTCGTGPLILEGSKLFGAKAACLTDRQTDRQRDKQTDGPT